MKVRSTWAGLGRERGGRQQSGGCLLHPKGASTPPHGSGLKCVLRDPDNAFIAQAKENRLGIAQAASICLYFSNELGGRHRKGGGGMRAR